MDFKNANSNELRNISNNIKDIANEYNMEINNVFTKLLSIPNETKEWVGNKANDYNVSVSLEKQQYIDFYNDILEFCNSLNLCADEVDTCIIKTESEDDYIGDV